MVATSKFTSGAWITILLIPLIVFGFERIHRHYQSVRGQLTLHGLPPSLRPVSPARVVIPISGVHRGMVNAVLFAQSISSNVTGLYVELFARKGIWALVPTKQTLLLQGVWSVGHAFRWRHRLSAGFSYLPLGAFLAFVVSALQSAIHSLLFVSLVLGVWPTAKRIPRPEQEAFLAQSALAPHTCPRSFRPVAPLLSRTAVGSAGV